MDHGAFGNLLFGLSAIQAEGQDDRPRRPPAAPRRERGGIRMALARSLRRMASVLERPMVSEVTHP